MLSTLSWGWVTMPRRNRLRDLPVDVSPCGCAVLRASGATRPHRSGQLSRTTPVATEFTEGMLHQRRQDDHSHARPSDPPLSHRRDRKRVIPLSSQHGYGEIAHQGTGTEQAGQADGAALTRARVGKSAPGYALRGFPNANLSHGYVTGRKRRCSTRQLRYTCHQPPP